MSGKLAVAGQTTVIQDQNGITLTDSATLDEMRLIGGAILMSVQDPKTGERKWKTGLTPEGISATLVTAGILNAGNITIMNVNEPVFRWDAFGLSAFDIDWSNSAISGKVNPFKFVRFDKHGIYGINQEDDKIVIDGRSWKPSSLEEIDSLATFALTWEGLKVTGSDGTVAKIGKHYFLPIGETDESKLNSRIVSITDKEGRETFAIDGSGNASFKGHIEATSGTFKGHIEATSGEIGGLKIEAVVDSANQPNANLLRNTKDKITNDQYYIAVYPLTIVPKVGDKYTISFKASPSANVKEIGIFNSDGDSWLTTIYPSSGDNGYYKGTFDWKARKNGSESTSVVIFMIPSGSGVSSIELVKLEKGSIATDWVAAIEDETTAIKNQVNSLDTELKEKLDAIGVGDYEWTFSVDNGIIMNSGGTEVFKVGNIDGTSGLEILGKITATAGDIAGWKISGNNLTTTVKESPDGYWDEFTASLGQDGLVLSAINRKTCLSCNGLFFQELVEDVWNSNTTREVTVEIGSSGCEFTVSEADTSSMRVFGLCRGGISEPPDATKYNLRVGDNVANKMQYLMGDWTVHNGDFTIAKEGKLQIGDTTLSEANLQKLLSLLGAG